MLFYDNFPDVCYFLRADVPCEVSSDDSSFQPINQSCDVNETLMERTSASLDDDKERTNKRTDSYESKLQGRLRRATKTHLALKQR